VRALVTGANGLVGANLVRDLLSRGVEVCGLVRKTSDLSALEDVPLELAYGDVTGDTEVLASAATGCELVFHTAMDFSYEPRRAHELDAAATRGTENMLRAAAAASARRVVVTSSSVVFGYTEDGRVIDEAQGLAEVESDVAYVASKIRQDRLAVELGKQLGLEVVIVCPTVCIGPHGTALGPSHGMILSYASDPFRMTYPGGCNLVSTADVAAGHWLAATRGTPSERYLIGSENLEWCTVHALVADLAGLDPPRIELNHGLSYLAATAEEVRARAEDRAPFITREQARMVGRYYWYSHAKAQRIGYAPRPARRALAEAIAWLAASSHVSRELRASMRLHDEVYAARWPKTARTGEAH